MQDCEHNQELCDQLSYMARYYTKRGEKFPYGYTYQKAVRALSELGDDLKRAVKITDVFIPRTGVDITEANIKKSRGKFPVKGVGKGVAQKILQFEQKGSIDEYNLAKADTLIAKKVKQGKIKKRTPDSKAVGALEKVSYIGRATAQKFVKNHGITSVAQLKKAAKGAKPDAKGAITFPAPKGGNIKLSKNQKKMLDYHDKLQRIPRDFTEMFEKTTRYLVKEKFGSKGYQIVFGGSYRRGAKDSGDIDILIKGTAFTLQEFVALLKKWGMIFDTLSEGKMDFKGMGRCPGLKSFIFRIDVLFTAKADWVAALSHFTGNDVLNRIMRLKAKELTHANGKNLPHGAILSQKGLFVRGANNKATKERVVDGGLKEGPPGRREEQLFKILGMKFIPAHRRGEKVR